MHIPIEVIGNMLDVPTDERGPLREWSLAILGALEPAPSDAVQLAGNTAVSAFCDYLDDLVARRRRQPGDPDKDVLTRLIQGQDGDSLSRTELLHNCIFILNAGHETTTNLIGNGLYLLAEHPSQRKLLQANSQHLSTAVDEFLRMESSNQQPEPPPRLRLWHPPVRRDQPRQARGTHRDRPVFATLPPLPVVGAAHPRRPRALSRVSAPTLHARWPRRVEPLHGVPRRLHTRDATESVQGLEQDVLVEEVAVHDRPTRAANHPRLLTDAAADHGRLTHPLDAHAVDVGVGECLLERQH